MSTWSNKITKISFKSEHVWSKVPAQKQSQKTQDAACENEKSDTSSESSYACVLFTILGNFREDFTTFVAETREPGCLPKYPCGVLWCYQLERWVLFFGLTFLPRTNGLEMCIFMYLFTEFRLICSRAICITSVLPCFWRFIRFPIFLV